MANATAARHDQRQTGDIVDVKLAAVKVYAGTLLTFNSAGYAKGAATKEAIAGVAIETVDNSGGSAGDKDVRVHRRGVFSFAGTGFAQTDVGKEAFATDNQTVTTATSGGAGRISVGRVVQYVSATEVRVQLEVNGVATVA